MFTDPYDDILNRAKIQLTPEERQRLVDELCRYAARKNGQRRSILDLQGLGKHVWEGVDPDDYVDQERNSWQD